MSNRWEVLRVEPPPEPCPCIHCGRLTQCLAGGWARVGDATVCHPNEVDRPDCFRMITVYGHDTKDCARCSQDKPWEPVTNAEILAGIIASLEQLREAVEDLDEQLLLGHEAS